MSGPPQIFDRRLYARRRAQAAGTDFLVADVADHIAERIQVLRPDAEQALDLSSRPESFTILKGCAARWIRTELSFAASQIVADEEWLPFGPETFDIVVSILGLHAVNDLPGALVQIRRALKPNGLFVAALFAGSTLQELRDAFASGESEIMGGSSPRVAPFSDVRDLGALLQRVGFASPVADLERSVVRYRAFDQMIADLRALGETNALQQRSRKFLRRDVLAATTRQYEQDYSTPEGRLFATFDVVYLTGRAPTTAARYP